ITAVADRDHVGSEPELVTLVAERDSAPQVTALGSDERARARREVRGAASERLRRPGDVSIDEAPHAGREDVDEPARRARSARRPIPDPPDVDGDLARGRDGVHVGVEPVRDAERAPEVAARPEADVAERRRAAGVEDPVGRFMERPVAADGDDERAPAAGGVTREVDPVAGVSRDLKVDAAQATLEEGAHLVQAARGVATA